MHNVFARSKQFWNGDRAPEQNIYNLNNKTNI